MGKRRRARRCTHDATATRPGAGAVFLLIGMALAASCQLVGKKFQIVTNDPSAVKNELLKRTSSGAALLKVDPERIVKVLAKESGRESLDV